MELIFLVAVVALAFAIRSAHTKISRLESEVQKLSSQQSQSEILHNPSVATNAAEKVRPQSISAGLSPIPTPPDTNAQFAPPAPTPLPQPVPVYSESVDPTQPFFLYTWFKDYTLIKIGSIIFFFGAAWFVSYAFEQNWIPPLLRFFLGLVLAVVIYMIGFMRRQIESLQYIVLTALGSAIVFVTVLAAQFSFVPALLPELVSLFILLVAISYTLWVAYETDTEWLAVTAVVAALFAPQFTGSQPTSPVPFLSYLFVIASGFGVVVLATVWRYVSLTLVAGVGMYLLSISTMPEQGAITWFFAVLFSALFLGLTTTSVLRNRVPVFIDGVTLLGTGLLFVYFVHTQALVPELAVFVAAAVTALVGYVARQREADPAAVLLYASISVISVFVGTAYLFDGFSATFFFALESVALVYFAMRYAFLKRTIMLAASTLLLPFVLGIEALFDSAWNTGIIHTPALAVVTVSAGLVAIGSYMFITAERAKLAWLRSLAQTTLFAWYGFTTVLLIVVARSLAVMTAGDVLLWSLILLLVLSVLITVAILSRPGVRNFTLWTYVMPIGAATGVLLQSGAEELFTITDMFVSSVMLGTLLVIMAVYGLLGKQHQLEEDNYSSYIFLWLSFLFTSAWFTILLGTLLSPSLTLTLSSVMFAALTYVITNALLRLEVRFDRIVPFLVALFVPAIGLLPSLSLRGWSDGILSIGAVSLYAYITLIVMMGVTLYHYANDRSNVTAKTFSSTLLIVGGLFSFVLVWVITHTITSSAVIAVTAALFTYTIVGLLTYVYGKRTNQLMCVRAGYLLLTAVVVRLGLVDVWDMDPFWRIITFLGIGALFIAAALLERAPDQSLDVQSE